MLNALELTGFKSFADKTRFEFPEGITVVVGPNGSGKSNIVDAVKWVLGATSAKSLRGKEMADVIFKTPSGNNRGDVNVAEVTIFFDNTQRILPLEINEVRVTRRVYRSGEGEYLINDEPCRLKDIKTLFRGTGIGADAYSIIEQGKVARMLDASPKDRRQIFEEAAGISRFKAKKLDALRRLGRVDQNLIRLSDIVDEVEGRLKAVRNQATKARRYKEYSDRLQQLRTQIGLVQWRQLSQQLQSFDDEIAQFQQHLNEQKRLHDQGTQDLLDFDNQLGDLQQQLQNRDSLATRNRENIAQKVTANQQQLQRLAELSGNISRLQIQLAVASHSVNGIQGRLQETEESLGQRDSQYNETLRALGELDISMSDLQDALSMAREETEKHRQRQISLAEQIAQTQSACNALKIKQQDNIAQFKQVTEDIENHDAQVTTLAAELKQLQATEESLGHSIHDHETEEKNLQRELKEQKQLFQGRQQHLEKLNARLTARRERETVLAELEQRREGISQSVTQLLSNTDGESDLGIVGLVADLLHCDHSTARWLDIALGHHSQSVVTQNHQLLHKIQQGEINLKTRIGIIHDQDVVTQPAPIDLTDHPGVLGRLDQMVTVDDDYQNLVTMLLGDTWVVQQLEQARALAKQYRDQIRIVTSNGELIDRHGTVSLGPPNSNTELISRRMELKRLQQDIYVLTAQAQDSTAELQRIQSSSDRLESERQQTLEQLTANRESLLKHHVHTQSKMEQLEQLRDHASQLDAQKRSLRAQQHTIKNSLNHEMDKLRREQNNLAQHKSAVSQSNADAHQLESEQRALNQKATQLRVDLGKNEQQLATLNAQLNQFELDHQERTNAYRDQSALLQQSDQKHLECTMQILNDTSCLAQLYLEKENHHGVTSQLRQQSADCAKQRKQISESLTHCKQATEQITQQKHERELASGELRLERTTLQQRLREDYDIEIAELHVEEETDAEIQQREQVEAEITTLRNKINNIGAVNMEALGELHELESRFETLSNQFQDLTAAKETTERIIQRINADSRRLFLETLEGIRVNFQSLYRQAFGGGQADIVLEEGVDVLEAGVEIITSPPGKPSISISLLSGGERALTAVSLLLAIFKFRPSPFCILDEVDAPFDEANIGRFINVLKDFLEWSRFVIVTHSKKTMTAADTLYGVTMQESGVSKQVSVRFEDVNEEGQISDAAIQRHKAA
ncbi:MAG: chromosome segregation protein SMC [Planctomycetota bacterium]|nr:chromosome segregation protein SMC [Planctomycetota bacterium]